MNKKRLKGSLIAIATLALLYFLLRYAGCFNPGQEKNANISLGASVKAPIAVAFYDANPGTQNKVIENLTITLIDPDGKVLSSSGAAFSEISVKTGLISLGLKTDAEVTDRKPYRFRLVAKAEGYLETIQTVILQNESPSYFPIYMASKMAPPSGVSVNSSNLPLAAGSVLATDAQIITQTGLGNVKLSFQKGTRLLNCGKSVEGNSPEAAITTAHGDPSNPNANRVFPNGFTVTDAIDSLGQVVASPGNTFDFVSAGWVDINLLAAGQSVNGFSKPVEVEMPVSSQFLNPATGLPVVVGDRIPLWSLSFQDGIWTNERSIRIEQGADGLVAKFPITHLSTWNLDFKGPRCTDDIFINYTNNGCPANLYSRIVDGTGVVYTPTSASAISNNVLPYAPGSGQFTVKNYPLVDGLQFQVFSGSGVPTPGDLPLSSVNIFSSSPPACPALATVRTLPAFTPPAPAGGCTGVYVEVDIEDGATSYDLCGNVLWYRVHGGAATWTAGGFFIGGTAVLLSPPAAAAGYDIRIWYESHEIIIEGISQDYFNASNTCTGSDQQLDAVFDNGGLPVTGSNAAAIVKLCTQGGAPSCSVGAPAGSSPENTTCTLGPGITRMSRVYINITVPAAVAGLMIGGPCS